MGMAAGGVWVVVVAVAATAAVGSGAGFRRVAESGSGDRVTRNTFGLGRKTPPEKFSGGGDIFIQLINTAYPLPLDTAYRSSGTETDSY
ncbi:hypothetical protein Tco_0359772 [Tanacetum coccineum]